MTRDRFGTTEALTGGLAVTALVGTLGEGGGSAIGLLVWHAALVALAVGLLVAGRLAGEPSYRVPPGLAAALAAFCVLVVAGALRAPYAFAAWLVVLELGAALTAFALAARCGPALVPIVVWPLRIGGAIHGAWLVGQRFVAGELRPASSFLNPNHAGAWLVVVTLVGVGALPRRRAPRALALGAAALSIAGVLVVGSRGAFLALACGALVLVAAAWPRIGRGGRRAAAAGGLLVVVVLGAAWAARARQADPFRYQRVRIWRASLAMVFDQPWWGSGPGQFAVDALRYQFPDEDGLLRYDRRFGATHSDVLRVPAEFGVPAAVAFALALAAAGAAIARRRAAAGRPAEIDAVLGALIAIAVQATVDNPSRWSSVSLCAAILLGAIVAEPRRPSPEASPLPRGLRWTLAAVFVVALTVGDAAPTIGVRLLASVPPGRLDAAELERVRRAATLNRLHPEPWRRLADHEMAALGGVDLAGYVRARQAAEAALLRQSDDPIYLRTLARIEADACRRLLRDERTRDRARALFARALGQAPRDAVLWLELAALSLDTGDPSGAVHAAERALDLEPSSIVPRLALAEALVDLGAVDRARALVAEARTLSAVAERDARSGAYAAALLVPDRRALARLTSRLADAGAPEALR